MAAGARNGRGTPGRLACHAGLAPCRQTRFVSAKGRLTIDYRCFRRIPGIGFMWGDSGYAL